MSEAQRVAKAEIVVGWRKRAGWVGQTTRFIRAKPLGAIGGLIALLMILAAIFAPWVARYDPYKVVGPAIAHPSQEFWFGTDVLGRDVYSRVIFGSRTALLVGFITAFGGVIGGSIIGLVSGYKGGHIDNVVQRIMDAVLSIPGLVLALAIIAVLGPSLTNAMIAISITIAPTANRVVRGATLSVKENSYVEAVRALGAGDFRIMLLHILPNVMAPIIVLVSIWLGTAIVIEASLSFLGLGAQPPTPSWGQMLSIEGRIYQEIAPMLALAPGIAISLVVLGINLFGDALRDALDPRLRGTQ